jgi:hypothetical protein
MEVKAERECKIRWEVRKEKWERKPGDKSGTKRGNESGKGKWEKNMLVKRERHTGREGNEGKPEEDVDRDREKGMWEGGTGK